MDMSHMTTFEKLKPGVSVTSVVISPAWLFGDSSPVAGAYTLLKKTKVCNLCSLREGNEGYVMM